MGACGPRGDGGSSVALGASRKGACAGVQLLTALYARTAKMVKAPRKATPVIIRTASHTRLAWPLATALVMFLAACGGGGGNAGAPPTGADTIAPTATLTAPADLATGLTGVVALAASAFDNVAVTGVDFQVDGTPVGSSVATPPYAASLDTGLYASGQHVVRARSRDAAGNVSPWASATVQFGGSRTQPAGFTRNEGWVTGLNGSATAFVQAPAPDGRLFVAQQGGDLRVVKGGVLLAMPFVHLSVDSSGERGLIGVTLHPNFAANGWVYVYYTTTAGGTHNRISRFTTNGDVAAAGELVVVDLPALSSATNHNGGAIHFGLDGKLYAGVGDNANSAHAQDLSSPFGKLLRFNEDGTIPADNPYFNSSTGLARAVWAYGLRNPFTFAVEPGTGRIHINDVGENTWEEIDLGVAASNYGWPGSEGPDNVGAGITRPVFTYKHSAAVPAGSGPGGFFTGDAIAGGTFYPQAGPFPADCRGSYFFADFAARFVARYDAANNAAYAYANLSGNPVDMLVGIDGALYVLSRDAIVRISAP